MRHLIISESFYSSNETFFSDFQTLCKLDDHLNFSASHCLKITQNVAFEVLNFPTIFVLFKLTCLVTLFDSKL